MTTRPDSERCFFCKNRDVWHLVVKGRTWRVCGWHLTLGARNASYMAARQATTVELRSNHEAHGITP